MKTKEQFNWFDKMLGRIPAPTPLEVAVAEYTQTQHGLLAALNKQEEADAEVEKLEARKIRLRNQLKELTTEDRNETQ